MIISLFVSYGSGAFRKQNLFSYILYYLFFFPYVMRLGNTNGVKQYIVHYNVQETDVQLFHSIIVIDDDM